MPKWLLGMLCFLTLHTHSQSVELRGRVVDASTNVPIMGAVVSTHHLPYFAVTDSVGFFTLVLSGAQEAHIHIEAVGYEAYAYFIQVPAPDQLIKLTPTLLELKQVVVESSLANAEYARQAVDMLSLKQSDLEIHRSQGLAQSLSHLPGINEIKSGVAISRPTIRGLSGTRILIADLGTKQEGQQWGSDHGLEIDQFAAENVEIIKGPASLLFGSEAMGGVIHLLPPVIPDKKWSGEVQTIGRTNNDYLASTAAIEARNKGLFVKSRITWAEFGDYRVPAESFVYLKRVLPIEDQRLKNTAGREFHTRTTIGLVNDRGSWKLTFSSYQQQAGLFMGIVGIPTVFNLASDSNFRNIDLPRADVHHYKTALNVVRRKKTGWLQWDSSFQDNRRTEYVQPHQEGYAPLAKTTTALDLHLQSLQSNLRWHMNQKGNYRFSYGLSASGMMNRRRGYEFLLPNYQQWQAGAYAYAEHQRPESRWVRSFGVRYDLSQFRSTAFQSFVYNEAQIISDTLQRSSSFEKNFSNVSASIGWSWLISEQKNFKINVGKSFRTPSAAELTINGIHHGTFRHEKGNAQLKAENGYQVDAVFVNSTGNSLWKISPFINYFDGYIYLRPAAQFSDLPGAGQLYEYQQNNAVFWGAEMSYEIHLIPQLHSDVALEYVYSYNLDSQLPLPFTPPFQVKSNVLYEYKETYIGTYMRWAAPQKRTDRNEKATMDYTLFDLVAGKEWEHWTLSFQINNVFNRRYLNHLSVYRQLNLPEQGRNFVLSVKFHFESKKTINS